MAESTHGGTRTGSGRKPATEPRRGRSIKATDAEWIGIAKKAAETVHSTNEYIIRMALGIEVNFATKELGKDKKDIVMFRLNPETKKKFDAAVLKEKITTQELFESYVDEYLDYVKCKHWQEAE